MRWDDIEGMRRAVEEIQRGGGIEAYKQRMQAGQDAFVHRQQGLDDPRSVTEAIKAAERFHANTSLELLVEFETAQNNETRRLLETLSNGFGLPDAFLNPGLRMPADVAVSNSLLEDYSRSFQTQLHDLDGRLSPANHIFEHLRASGASWTETMRSATERVSSPFTAHVLEASLAWRVNLEALTERFSTLGLIDTHPQLARRLIRPSRVFTRFSRHTLKRLEGPTSELEQTALGGSLILAEQQLIDSSSTLETTVVVPVDAEGFHAPTTHNNFKLQQQDLLASQVVPLTSDASQLLDLSPAAQLSACSRRCVSLVTHCNKANCLRGGTDIFKPTTRFVDACNDLPWIVAQDQHTLANFVESLYFILYEAAGARNLRFITEGLMTITECDAVFFVKFLRTNG